ncbi:MAG: DUF3352 domain-containing protein [Aeromicrobium sp.]|uniref:DUF3352 domain-containing protein n=1 Tax=Aeromicrobium sp. TaxID=1871063 RepID=UPI0039E23892
MKIGAGVLGAVLVVGGVGYGGYTVYDKTLGGGGPQPADALPANTIAYARVDLDPSASQKIALMDLIDRLPDVKKELGIEGLDSEDDLRETAFTDWFDLEDECGVSYADDVEPWIGQRVGVALTDDFEISDDEDETGESLAKSVALVIQVTDEEKAKDGITKLATECGIMEDIDDELGTGDEPGIAFREGYAVVTVDQDAADAMVEAANGSSLSSNDKFSSDMDTLGEDGVASVWYDQAAINERVEQAMDEFGGVPSEVEDMMGYYSKVDSSAATLRATDDSLELAGVASLTEKFEAPEAEGLAGLPEDTLAGLSIVGGGKLAEKAWEAFLPWAEMSGEFDSYSDIYEDEDCFDAYLNDTDYYDYEEYAEEQCGISSEPVDVEEMIEEQTGLSMPDDLATVLGDEFNIYLGSSNIDDIADAVEDEDVEGVLESGNAGIEIVSDGDPAAILEDLTDLAGVDIDITETDSGAIIATNDGAADTLENDNGLGGTDAFTSVAEGHDRPLGGFYVDLAAAFDAIEAVDSSAGDELDDYAFLKALGVTAWMEDDTTVGFSAKLSFTNE